MAGRLIHPARGPLKARLHAVPSKSVTHRALVAAALARGTSLLRSPLEADDTLVTRDGLAQLGFSVRCTPEGWSVEGRAGRVPGGGTLQLGASGTSFRFLAAVAALGEEPSRLDGTPRLRQRPVEELLQALEGLGARVERPPAGSLPLIVGGRAWDPQAARVGVRGARSSQFASALLLVGARRPRGLELVVEPPAVSLPYVELTAHVLRGFGVPVERTGPATWRVPPCDYAGRDFAIEGDHSSASYFFAAAMLLGGSVRLEGLDPYSPQADARFPKALRELGATVRSGEGWIEVEGTGRLPGFEVDLTEAPDLAPTFAALALFAEGTAVLRGVAHLRHKESDRLELVARNLRRLGREAWAEADRLVVRAPAGRLRGGPVETAGDHRIAMAFAVAGLRLGGVVLDDAACVAKSYPRFWDDLGRLTSGR